MTPLESKLKDILYMLDSVRHDHNERNYGDRDRSLHILLNKWEEFIELHPDSEDPCTLSIKGSIKIIE